MRAFPRPLFCAVLLFIGLFHCALVQADNSGIPRARASCPQLQYTAELPPVAFDPDLVLNADNVDATSSGLSRLTGSVHLSQKGRAFAGQAVDYDAAQKFVYVNSESFFRDPRLVIKSQRAEFNLDAQTGEFFDANFTLLSLNGRGTADRVFVTETNLAEMDHATYTSCAPGNESWLLSARKLDFNGDAGLGVAHDATLRFETVPFIYLPYFQFPLDNDRHTGLLAPIVGESTQRGFDIRQPIYLNLAPNYDATLTPRILSRRGEQLGGDFRDLFEHSEGTFHGEYLPDDDQTGQERNYINFEQAGQINSRLGAETHFANVSDRNYFSDFGSTLDQSATNFLARGASLTYQAPASYTVSARVENYQPVSNELNGVDEPYTRLPQIRIDALTKNSLLDTRAGIDGEFTNFARANSIEGQRLIAQPYLRWQEDHNAWYASAQADLNYTAYNLTGTAPSQQDSPRRSLPFYALDGGLRFERETDGGALQTLEPHLQYLLVPYRNQDQLPLFDSGQPDFDFPQLFAFNRYSGSDRFADANQFTSAVTTRLIDPVSGLVRFTASFGEVYKFVAPRVGVPDLNPPGFPAAPANLPSSGSSDYVTEFNYQVNQRWSTDAETETTPEFDRFIRSAVALRYRQPDAGLNGQRFDIAYRYRDGLLQQTDASFSTPINDNWRIASRLRYSLRDSHSLESFAGVEYQTCCWAVRGTYRRYLSGSNGDFSNGVYFQIELKGLARLGNGFDTLLPAIDPDAPVVGRNASKVLP